MPTVLHRLAAWAQENPSDPAQRYKEKGQWKTITSKQFCDNMFHLALYLESRGFGKNDVSAILSYNCPEWVQTDLAAVLLGAKSAGLYPNSSKKDIDYILNHTAAKVLAVQNKTYFEKITLGGTCELPASVEVVLVFNGDTSFSPKAVAYSQAILEGQKLAANKKLSTYLDKVDPHAGAFMIYTSGTTGSPKGALLSHDNLAYTSDLAAKAWKLRVGTSSLFSFLPLCHIAEKMQNVGIGLSLRYRVDYCTSFDNVAKEIVEAQPTLLLSVPRLWEKMMSEVNAKVANATGAKKILAPWALSVGARLAEKKYAGQTPGIVDKLQYKIADKLVLSKIRYALGFSKLELAASVAAALPAQVTKWFRSLNIEIVECFGQTESTGVIIMTTPGVDCLGSVGAPVPGTEFKLGPDGEIMTKGRHVFKEYYKNPASTAETIVDGWLHSGDLGELTERGFIRIRGRKKEIMKSSGGKMVAPVPIEELLKEAPMIAQVCMVGDGRKYFSALITLNENVKSDNAVVTQPEIVSAVGKYVEGVNQSLANFEQIKYFTILARDFSIEEGELTPTMKMKRNVIEDRYKGIIDLMYS